VGIRIDTLPHIALVSRKHPVVVFTIAQFRIADTTRITITDFCREAFLRLIRCEITVFEDISEMRAHVFNNSNYTSLKKITK